MTSPFANYSTEVQYAEKPSTSKEKKSLLSSVALELFCFVSFCCPVRSINKHTWLHLLSCVSLWTSWVNKYTLAMFDWCLPDSPVIFVAPVRVGHVMALSLLGALVAYSLRWGRKIKITLQIMTSQKALLPTKIASPFALKKVCGLCNL